MIVLLIISKASVSQSAFLILTLTSVIRVKIDDPITWRVTSAKFSFAPILA